MADSAVVGMFAELVVLVLKDPQKLRMVVEVAGYLILLVGTVLCALETVA